MSYFNKSKRKSKLKTTLISLGATACAFALLNGTAYADPEKKVEDAAKAKVEMVDEAAEQATEQAKDQVKDMATDAAKDAVQDTGVAPMDLPQAEGEADSDVQATPEAPETTVEPPVWETPATKEPAVSSMPVPSVKQSSGDVGQSCYAQESGALECICEGDTACAELTSSDICEPGTSWRNDEGFGGCTKKAE